MIKDRFSSVVGMLLNQKLTDIIYCSLMFFVSSLMTSDLCFLPVMWFFLAPSHGDLQVLTGVVKCQLAPKILRPWFAGRKGWSMHSRV